MFISPTRLTQQLFVEWKNRKCNEIHIVVKTVSTAVRSWVWVLCLEFSLGTAATANERLYTSHECEWLFVFVCPSVCLLTSVMIFKIAVWRAVLVHLVLWLYSKAAEQDSTRTPRPWVQEKVDIENRWTEVHEILDLFSGRPMKQTKNIQTEGNT